jgi:hypothetical protein
MATKGDLIVPTLTIQLDQSMVDDAADVAIGMKQAGHMFSSSDPPQPVEHIMHSAMLIGLKAMKETWPVLRDAQGNTLERA